MNIDEAIKVAKEHCNNEYAVSYLDSIPKSIEFGGQINEAIHAFEVQLLYAYSNMQYWRGDRAKEVKGVFKKYLLEKGMIGK
jgi:type II secretory pathway component PulF